jgi:hypothetical protein
MALGHSGKLAPDKLLRFKKFANYRNFVGGSPTGTKSHCCATVCGASMGTEASAFALGINARFGRVGPKLSVTKKESLTRISFQCRPRSFVQDKQ